MREFSLIELSGVGYLYVSRVFDTSEMAFEIAVGLEEVWSFMEDHHVPAAGGAITLHNSLPNSHMDLNMGFLANSWNLDVTGHTVKSGHAPAGMALHYRHVGSYDVIPEIYDDVRAYAKEVGLTTATPIWQIYRNDLSTVHESELITDCYQALTPEVL